MAVVNEQDIPLDQPIDEPEDDFEKDFILAAVEEAANKLLSEE